MKILGTVLLIGSLYAGTASASVSPVGDLKKNEPMRDARTEARIEVLQKRLEEIRKMDFGELETAEKSEVKKELREIRRELKAYNASGIYISLGGLIIIVLLLILLL